MAHIHRSISSTQQQSLPWKKERGRKREKLLAHTPHLPSSIQPRTHTYVYVRSTRDTGARAYSLSRSDRRNGIAPDHNTPFTGAEEKQGNGITRASCACRARGYRDEALRPGLYGWATRRCAYIYAVESVLPDHGSIARVCVYAVHGARGICTELCDC